MQVPAATAVMFSPETVQIPVVLDVSVTVKPESADAPDANVSATDLSAGWANVIVCAAPDEILKLRVTGDAGAYVESPAWLALNWHVPAATRVTTKPETVQVLGVREDSVTVKPDDAVAASVYVPLLRVLSVGFKYVIDCAVLAEK